VQRLTKIIFVEGDLFLHSGDGEFCASCSETSTQTELTQNKIFLSLCTEVFSKKIKKKPLNFS